MPTTNRSRAHAAATPANAALSALSSESFAGRLLLALSATLVVAIASHISFPLWFTPVPLSLQPLAVLGVGLALGPELAFVALCGYLLEGAAGLPVFSPTGLGGMRQLLGPTGGYLCAYPFVAALAGWTARALTRRSVPSFFAALTACLAAVALLYASGATWLGLWLHLPLAAAINQGISPFVAAAGTYRALSRRAL
jgi:biotin transport system substrate-specific component